MKISYKFRSLTGDIEAIFRWFYLQPIKNILFKTSTSLRLRFNCNLNCNIWRPDGYWSFLSSNYLTKSDQHCKLSRFLLIKSLNCMFIMSLLWLFSDRVFYVKLRRRVWSNYMFLPKAWFMSFLTSPRSLIIQFRQCIYQWTCPFIFPSWTARVRCSYHTKSSFNDFQLFSFFWSRFRLDFAVLLIFDCTCSFFYFHFDFTDSKAISNCIMFRLSCNWKIKIGIEFQNDDNVSLVTRTYCISLLILLLNSFQS